MCKEKQQRSLTNMYICFNGWDTKLFGYRVCFLCTTY